MEKKALLSILLMVSLFAISSPVIGQIGITAGANYSFIRDGEQSDRFETDLGYQAGIDARYYLSEHFTLEGGIIFARMNGRVTTYDNIKNTTLNEVQVPVRIGYYPVKQVGILMGVQLDLRSDYKVKDASIEDDLVTTGLSLTGGFNFINNETITLYTRFNYGLSPVIGNMQLIDKYGEVINHEKVLKLSSIQVGATVYLFKNSQ